MSETAIKSLVSKLGGPLEIATRIGASRAAVAMWATVGRIPYRWRPVVRDKLLTGIDITDREWRELSLEPPPMELTGRPRKKQRQAAE